MSLFAELRPESWDLYKGKIEDVDSWFLMSTPGPAIAILLSYLLFVLRVGPKIMEKREPMKLNTTLIVYNIVQVVFSIFLSQKLIVYHYNHGIIPTGCIKSSHEKELVVASCIWWYFIAKITELLDTVFFVLRKKYNQVTFLHVYHHSIMMFGTWVYLKYAPTDQVIFLGLLNCLVHIVMYAYYGLAAMGPRVAKYLWWKKYMTKIQLTQFILMLTYIVASAKSYCHFPQWTIYLSIFLTSSFLFLFIKFYVDSYKRSHNKASELNNFCGDVKPGIEGNGVSKKAIPTNPASDEKSTQFGIMLLFLVFTSYTSTCRFPRGFTYFCVATILAFASLFLNFYIKSYKEKSGKTVLKSN